jgi:hypothetical protein
MGSFLRVTAFLLFTLPLAWPVHGEGRPVLLLRDYKSGRTLLEIPLLYNQTFTIRYIHSVDHAPVFETFRVVQGKGLFLEETYFRMFGAGMGHWQGHGTLVQEGRWIRIRDIHQLLGSFLLRVGSPGVDHTVVLNEREWNLSEMAAGRLLEVGLSREGDATRE